MATKAIADTSKGHDPHVSGDSAESRGARTVDANIPDSPAVWRIERRDYYVQLAHRLIISVSALSVAVVFAVLLTGYALFRGPVIQNYALTPDLRVVELTALNQPVVTEQALRNWTADALRDIYSYDFVHWRDQISSTRDLFSTNKAFQGFIAALKKAGTLPMVRQDKLVVSSILRDPPVITSKGMYQGRYSWRVEVPVNIRYESVATSLTQKVMITLLIQRVPQTQNPRGLGISQIVAPRR